jgi:hypothetical protein
MMLCILYTTSVFGDKQPPNTTPLDIFADPNTQSPAKTDQKKDSSSSTNQTSQQPLQFEQNFKDDTYENFAPREKDERKIFDEELLGS